MNRTHNLLKLILKQKRLLPDFINKPMMLLYQSLEILRPLQRESEFLEKPFEHVVQKMENQGVIQVDHFAREIETSADERVGKYELFFAEF